MTADEKIEVRAGVERGPVTNALHCHAYVTISHWSQIRINKLALQGLFKETYNLHASAGKGRMPLKSLPACKIDLMPQTDWGHIVAHYLSKQVALLTTEDAAAPRSARERRAELRSSHCFTLFALLALLALLEPPAARRRSSSDPSTMQNDSSPSRALPAHFVAGGPAWARHTFTCLLYKAFRRDLRKVALAGDPHVALLLPGNQSWVPAALWCANFESLVQSLVAQHGAEEFEGWTAEWSRTFAAFKLSGVLQEGEAFSAGCTRCMRLFWEPAEFHVRDTSRTVRLQAMLAKAQLVTASARAPANVQMRNELTGLLGVYKQADINDKFETLTSFLGNEAMTPLGTSVVIARLGSGDDEWERGSVLVVAQGKAKDITEEEAEAEGEEFIDDEQRAQRKLVVVVKYHNPHPTELREMEEFGAKVIRDVETQTKLRLYRWNQPRANSNLCFECGGTLRSTDLKLLDDYDITKPSQLPPADRVPARRRTFETRARNRAEMNARLKILERMANKVGSDGLLAEKGGPFEEVMADQALRDLASAKLADYKVMADQDI
ncbi:hypothetical protein T492DRAFT_866813 [Pavlovales sp. CCMP2436]|nr:hypothetical protein T492DRAFT_866813 [Pavlovales sp. CCMP2436]